MLNRILILGVSSLLVMLSGCNDHNVSTKPATPIATVQPQGASMKGEQADAELKATLQALNKTAWQQGTVQYYNLEGGFYGIVTTDGKRILPMNLSKEYKIIGAVIKFRGKALDVKTIQQWGTPFKLTEVQLISAGSAPGGNNSQTQ